MSTDSLVRLDLAGDPYDIGLGLGRFGREAVHGHLLRTAAWARTMEHRDNARLQAMAGLVDRRLPDQAAELHGLADGLGLPFDAVFAWNSRGDLGVTAPDGCTTVRMPGARRVIAHNEDGDPGLRGHCALLHAAPRGRPAFTAFVYPGSLPGHTFAATAAGLVMAVNNIRAPGQAAALPRMVLTRAALACHDLDAVIALLRACPRAGAFHLTLGQIGDPRLLGVEFTTDAVSVRELTAPSLHANHLVHPDLAAASQVVTASSADRQRRGDALVAAGTDPLTILRDAQGPGLPIRRDDPADPDDENTLATVVFILSGSRLEWQVYGHAEGPPCYEAVG